MAHYLNSVAIRCFATEFILSKAKDLIKQARSHASQIPRLRIRIDSVAIRCFATEFILSRAKDLIKQARSHASQIPRLRIRIDFVANRDKIYVLVAAVMGLVMGCHPRPIAELALADVAMKAAHRAKADSLAPDTFRKAENYYLRAKNDFAGGYFQACRKNSDEARRLAEQAEYQSLKKQNQIRGVEGSDFDPSPVFDNPPPEGY